MFNKNFDIVLSGGGSKLMMHVGFMQAITEKEIRFEKIVGVSAGAIISSVVCSGNTPNHLYDIIYNLDLGKVVFDIPYPFYWLNLYKRGYCSQGRKLKEFLFKYLSDRKFKDIDKDLYIVAYCLDDRETEVFSKSTHPDVKIIDAVLASSALPFLFEPRIINGKRYTDGGIAKNFPVDLPQLGNRIIGHLIDSSYSSEYDGGISFARLIFDNVFYANPSASIYDVESLEKELHVIRTFSDESFFDFNLDKKKKLKMFYDGFHNTQNAIKDFN